MMARKWAWSLWLLILMVSSALAAEAPPKSLAKSPANAPANPPNKVSERVHDFESDTIEGANKGVDLFRQTGTDTLSVDAMIYLRDNFNEFLDGSARKRPILAGEKGK